MAIYLAGIFTGIIVMILLRAINARGHAVFGVESPEVQRALGNIVSKYTSLRYLHTIHSGPTHQDVFSGGTVIACFDQLPEGLPRNARSYVVWGKKRRMEAAQTLVERLIKLGYRASINEPMKEFPPGTFLMVTSNAFANNAQAFRPHGVKMAILEKLSKKKLAKA